MAVAQTTVAEPLDATETGVDVANVLGFPASGNYTVRVDSEWMQVTAGQGTTTWTVTRGYNSTTAATHLTGATIFHVEDTYPMLDRIKRRLRSGADSETTADDDLLSDFITAVHSYMVSKLGMFLGPTTETSIDLDGRDAAIDYHTGKRSILYIPFGIQSLTSVQVRPWTDATLETVTAADIISHPRAWETRVDPNQPTTKLSLKDVVDGSWDHWPDGVGNITVTGTLGWSAPPVRLTEIADTVVIRMFQAAASGQRDLIGTDDEGLPVVSRFLSSMDRESLRTFLGEVSGFAST